MRHMGMHLFIFVLLLCLLSLFHRNKGEKSMLEGIHETLLDLRKRIEHMGECL